MSLCPYSSACPAFSFVGLLLLKTFSPRPRLHLLHCIDQAQTIPPSSFISFPTNIIKLSSTMPVSWDANTERQLLLCVISNCAKPDWKVVAAAMGSEYSEEGVRSVFALLTCYFSSKPLPSSVCFCASELLCSTSLLFSFSASSHFDHFHPISTFNLQDILTYSHQPIPHPFSYQLPSSTMPFKWDPPSERNLLLYAVSEMGHPPSTIWEKVAEKIGGGLNGNACRYPQHLSTGLLACFSLLYCLLLHDLCSCYPRRQISLLTHIVSLQPEVLQAQEGIREVAF